MKLVEGIDALKAKPDMDKSNVEKAVLEILHRLVALEAWQRNMLAKEEQEAKDSASS